MITPIMAVSAMVTALLVLFCVYSFLNHERRSRGREEKKRDLVIDHCRDTPCPSCGEIKWEPRYCTGHYYKVECKSCGFDAGNDNDFLGIVYENICKKSSQGLCW